MIWAHLAVGLWNITIVLLDFECPVTGVEKHWMRKGGEEPYAGGYIEHYLDGTHLAGGLHLAGRDHRLRAAGDLLRRPVLRQSPQPANQGRVSGDPDVIRVRVPILVAVSSHGTVVQDPVEPYLAELSRALAGPRRRKADLMAEARDSLVDATEAYEADGLRRGEAAERAVAETSATWPRSSRGTGPSWGSRRAVVRRSCCSS